MGEFDFFKNLINNALVQLHTAYVGKVTAVNGETATILPLTYSKGVTGELLEQAPVTAYIPENVKYKSADITYVTDVSYSTDSGIRKTSETTTVLVPDTVAIDDIVLCVVCERDITQAVQGKLAEPSKRWHDMNDSIIIKVLRGGTA